MKKKFKLLILGYGGHGKDTSAGKICDKLGLTFQSSSQFACDHIVYPWFDERLPGYYETMEECFTDRRSWRPLWYYLIRQYNSENPARLAQEVMQQNDCYVGMRSVDEYVSCKFKQIFTHVIWIDASKRLPREGSSSCSIHCNIDNMIYVDNNSDQLNLENEVDRVVKLLQRKRF